MHHTIKKTFLGAAASIAVLGGAGTASAAEPGTPPVGTITSTVSSGDGTTPFTLRVVGGNPADPTNGYCPGDAANQGYRWQTYIAPAAVDVATLEFDGEGVHTTRAEDASYDQYVWNLFSVGQDPIGDQNPALNPAGFLDLSGNKFSFQVFEEWELLPAGDYNLGIACTKSRVLETYWALPVTVTVAPGGAVTWRVNDGPPTDVPEAPLSVLLPLTGLAAAAGVVLYRRRGSATPSTAAA